MSHLPKDSVWIPGWVAAQQPEEKHGDAPLNFLSLPENLGLMSFPLCEEWIVSFWKCILKNQAQRKQKESSV